MKRPFPSNVEDLEARRTASRLVEADDEQLSVDSQNAVENDRSLGRERLSTVCFGPFRFDLHRLELRRGSDLIELQRRHAEALAILVSRPGQIVTREELIDELWGRTIVEYDKSLRPIINRLRLALADSARHPRYLETVRGQGYRFLESVREVEAAGEEPPVPRVALSGRSWRGRVTGLIAVSLFLGVVGYLVSNDRHGAVISREQSLAVLPFEAKGELSPSDLEIVNGLALDLAGELTRRGGESLRVVLPQFSKPVPSDRTALGDVLGADLLLHGTVERSSGRYGSALSVVDVRSGEVLWSKQRSAVSLASLGASWPTLPSLFRELRVPIDQPKVVQRTPRESALRALFHLGLRGQRGLQAVRDLCQSALEETPGDPELLGLLATAEMRQWVWSLDLDDAEQARGYALKALEADPMEFRSLQAMARLSFFVDRDAMAGQDYLDRARTVNPRDPGLQIILMNFRLSRGELAEALRIAEEASRANPLAGVLQTEANWVRYGARDFETVTQKAADAIRLAPRYVMAHEVNILALEALGRREEAAAAADKLLRLVGSEDEDRSRIIGEMVMNDFASGFWLAWLDELHSGSMSVVYPEEMAIAFAALGEESMAIDWLEQAWERKTPWLGPVLRYPVFDSLRDTPEFGDLQSRLLAAIVVEDSRSFPLEVEQPGGTRAFPLDLPGTVSGGRTQPSTI